MEERLGVKKTHTVLIVNVFDSSFVASAKSFTSRHRSARTRPGPPATDPETAPATPAASPELSEEDFAKLFNSPVFKAEWMVRPLVKLPVVIGPIAHTGVRVTLRDGSQWLIHKGPNYGRDSDTVVTSAKNMSEKWSRLYSRNFEGKKTVSDLVKAGGKSFNLVFNCHTASIMIMLQ